MIIEFAGVPRSGKTTIANKLVKEIPQINLHPECFEEIPQNIKGNFDKNYWYAKFTANRIATLSRDNKINIIENVVYLIVLPTQKPPVNTNCLQKKNL